MAELLATLGTSIVTTTFLVILSVCFLFSYTWWRMKLSKKWLFTLMTFLSLSLWFTLVYVLSQQGFFLWNPLIAPFFLLSFIILFEILRRVYASNIIQNMVFSIPNHWLIAIQTYRVGGYVFLQLYTMGVLPAIFAFPSAWGDIIIGMSAPIVAYCVYKKKSFAITLAKYWNYLGIADLVIALSTGILAFSRPIQTIPVQPSTEILSLYPLAIIPLFAVPLALFLHCLSLKILKGKTILTRRT